MVRSINMQFEEVWNMVEKADEQMSIDVGIDHRAWISQKMQKRKVLEKPVPLQ